MQMHAVSPWLRMVAMRARVDMSTQLMERHPASAVGSLVVVAGDVVDDRCGVLCGHATIIAHVVCHVKCHESWPRRGLPRVGTRRGLGTWVDARTPHSMSGVFSVLVVG